MVSVATGTLKEKSTWLWSKLNWQTTSRHCEIIIFSSRHIQNKNLTAVNDAFQARLGSDVTGLLSHGKIRTLENENVRPSSELPLSKGAKSYLWYHTEPQDNFPIKKVMVQLFFSIRHTHLGIRHALWEYEKIDVSCSAENKTLLTERAVMPLSDHDWTPGFHVITCQQGFDWAMSSVACLQKTFKRASVYMKRRLMIRNMAIYSHNCTNSHCLWRHKGWIEQNVMPLCQLRLFGVVQQYILVVMLWWCPSEVLMVRVHSCSCDHDGLGWTETLQIWYKCLFESIVHGHSTLWSHIFVTVSQEYLENISSNLARKKSVPRTTVIIRLPAWCVLWSMSIIGDVLIAGCPSTYPSRS